jgi:hypothetical protein
MLDRGADRENAKALVRELGLDDVVTWGPSLPRDELFAAMLEADLIVDQFDVGAFGLTALEAFQVGRPVLTYVDQTCERLVYDDNSPVLTPIPRTRSWRGCTRRRTARRCVGGPSSLATGLAAGRSRRSCRGTCSTPLWRRGSRRRT